MKGTPQTMQNFTRTYYDNIKNNNNTTISNNNVVAQEVATTLVRQSREAQEMFGIHYWKQIIDPGIGFAKDVEGNLDLLRNIDTIRTVCNDLPVLFGTSRKGFLDKILQRSKTTTTTATTTEPFERDPGTMASYVAAICLSDNQRRVQQRNDPNININNNNGIDVDGGGSLSQSSCNIVRVHNVADCRQAMVIMDAIRTTELTTKL
jgi:dihydropteroate synthase